ncbi:MAG: kinesin, partial [Rhizobiales bacterium]|nr:kinesin [Hyphomicrobiales bacterium]
VAFSRAEERSSLIAGNLRGGIQSSFNEVGRILGETEKRAEAAANTLRESLVKAGEEAGQSVEGAFTRAEERTKEVAARLRGSVGASLTDVDRMLAESCQKSEAATTVMRDTLRQAVEEAVGKFSGATEEIRRAAADIRKELDQTRGELKRGAFDLPEEAKENAAQMRRAVSEQIKALQDLSDIIGKSSSALEVSRPAVQAPVAQPVQPARVEPRREEPAQLRGSLGIERAATVAVPQQRAQPVPAEADAKVAGGEGGWMRDLLRGAVSREEAQFSQPRGEGQAARPADARNPRHVVESLNSLSVDIARAIDHDASVDLWRRYQRGERDVFTRRLYTLKGQQTFDEIKRKYEREPEFRTAVDRYISDFEKLLADVARNDRDKVMTQTYLTSDTGKVYTMLAHAAGRFN